MSRLGYRKEIDGLRSIAVLPVIFFHLNIDSFIGGYLGVDIFFVISGYLITSIIYLELKDSTFNILNFYERRIRRIVPVLTTVILFTLPLSWYLMVPNEFEEYLLSIFSTILFFSNILFWNQSDYFDNPSEFKPLLHTWSLSIEEQFYLFFPIIFLILYKYFKTQIFKIFIISFFLSYFLAIYSSSNYESANFYLLPTRAWEILSGSISALILIRFANYKEKIFKNKNNLITNFGFILILFSFYFFDSSTKHPGVLTLLPVLGTVLIILSTPNNGIVSKFLSLRFMVYTGLLSYSLYLWHVPLITFIKIYRQSDLLFTDKIAVLLFTVFLSIISYNLIEKKFKNKNLFTSKQIYTNFFISVFLLIGISSTLYFTDIFTNNIENRLDDDSRDLYKLALEHTNTDTLLTRYDNNECKFFSLKLDEEFIERFDNCIESQSEKAVILLGDSHAMNLHNIAYLSTNSNFFVTIANGGSRIKLKDNEYSFKDIFEFIQEYKLSINKVYYHQSGSYLIEDYKGRVDSAEIYKSNKSYLIKNSAINLNLQFLSSLPTETIWIGPFLESRQDFVRQIISGRKEFEIPNSHKSLFDELDYEILSRNNNKVLYVPFDQVYQLKPDEVFVGSCLFYRDGDHLSLCAEDYIGNDTKFFENK
tara:strand:- start:2423 stop:4366 length:1944 start_codon:yes stop_codon:yes gene_type:complete